MVRSEVFVLPSFPPPQIRALWGKTWSQGGTRHLYPLLLHLLDAGAACEFLWEQALAPHLRSVVCDGIGQMDDQACRCLCLLVSLHDIGKAWPAFAYRSSEAADALRSAGLWPISGEHGLHHASVTAAYLDGWVSDRRPAAAVAAALAGHHGTIPSVTELGKGRQAVHVAGLAPEWQPWGVAVAELRGALEEAWGCTFPDRLPITSHPFYGLLAGITVVSDWLASNERCLPGRTWDASPADCLSASRRRIREVAAALGWVPRPVAAPSADLYRDAFPHVTKPSPLQDAVLEGVPPGIAVIESTTGSGKTEAALALADTWMRDCGYSGFYVALPTQATANQMQGRVEAFLARRYPGQQVPLLLMHGTAAINADQRERLARGGRWVLGEQGADERENVVASEWFAQGKEGLFAPFGVGTIDQLLLSVVHSRHHFLRLAGSSGKVVIFDEIHAYDAYTNRLIERLLEWLGALGAPAILLSATLPGEQRGRFLEAYAAGREQRGFDAGRACVPVTSYPRISWLGADGVRVRALPADTGRQQPPPLQVETWQIDLNEHGWPGPHLRLADDVLVRIERGGCAAVICATVRSAQLMARAFSARTRARGEQIPLTVLHARFPVEDRERIEKQLLQDFGPDATRRPRKAVVVATSVIEQSLDIDFDLMVTQLAPLDLLLQRGGRLHRHAHRARERYGLQRCLYVVMPPDPPSGPPLWDQAERVYHPHALLRSRVLFQGLDAFDADPSAATDTAYRVMEAPTALPEAWKVYWRTTQDGWRRRADDLQSKAHPIGQPWGSDYLTPAPRAIDDEEPLPTATRWVEDPSSPVVLLYGDESTASFDPEGTMPADWRVTERGEREQVLATIYRLARRAVPVPHRWFAHKAPPRAEVWAGLPVLRHYGVAFLDQRGWVNLGKRNAQLAPQIGLWEDRPSWQDLT